MTQSLVPRRPFFPVDQCWTSRPGRGWVETGQIRSNLRDRGIRALSYPPSKVIGCKTVCGKVRTVTGFTSHHGMGGKKMRTDTGVAPTSVMVVAMSVDGSR
jgi:hypothetical protein